MLDLGLAELRRSILCLDWSRYGPDAWWHERASLTRCLPDAEMAALKNLVRTHLYGGPGLVVIRLGAAVPADSVRLLQLALADRFGDILTVAPDEPGRPLFKISAVEGQGGTGDYTGNAKNTNSIGLHTDGSGVSQPVAILGMSCIRPARSGGESRFADAGIVRGLVSKATLRLLESPLPRENPYEAMPSAQLLVAPIFDPKNGRFSYHPARVRNGIAQVRGALSAPEFDALQELDRTLEAAAIDFRLETGDIVMLDNTRLAHDRRPFTDDPKAPRLLERLWIGFGQARES